MKGKQIKMTKSLQFLICILLFLPSCSLFSKKNSISSDKNLIPFDANQFNLKTYAELPERKATENVSSVSELKLIIAENSENVRLIAETILKVAKQRFIEKDLENLKKELEQLDEKFVFLNPYSRDVVWTLLLGLQSKSEKFLNFSLEKVEEILNDKNNLSVLENYKSLVDEILLLNADIEIEKDPDLNLARHNYFLELNLMGYDRLKLDFQNIYNSQLEGMWSQIQQLKAKLYLDPYAQERDLLKRKIFHAVQLAQLMDEKKIKYSFLADDLRFSHLRTTVENFLYQNTVTTELTEESKKLNSLRRKGFISN